MYFILFIEGIAIGFLLATPIGPIGVLCVRRTLSYGSRHGFIVGLGGASADIAYALIAALGVSFISNFVQEWQFWIRFGGGIILLLLGIYILLSHPTTKAAAQRSNVHRKLLISTFLLALTNPMSMFAFGAVFSSTKIMNSVVDKFHLLLLVAGVFCGSLLWFSLLSSVTSIFQKKITNGGLAIVNRIAGTLFIIFGATSVWSCASNL